MSELTQNLNKRAKELGMTQRELAERSGISQVAIHKLLTGKTKTTSKLNFLASALQCTAEWLENGTEGMEGGSLASTPTSLSVSARKIPLLEKHQLGDYFNKGFISSRQANAEIATALGAGPKTLAYIEASEGMMDRITPKDTVYIDPEGKLEPNSIGIFMFKVGMDYQLGTLKSTPGGLMLQFDSNEPGWDSIAVSEDDYVGRLAAYVPHWLAN
jgi:transcriptional regulator with XRE-family HTH domain